jgi:hypothetical protein
MTSARTESTQAYPRRCGIPDRELSQRAYGKPNSPFEEYHDFSSSETKFLTSLSRFSLTPLGRITEDQGRDGLETGPSQLATLGLQTSEGQIHKTYVWL